MMYQHNVLQSHEEVVHKGEIIRNAYYQTIAVLLQHVGGGKACNSVFLELIILMEVDRRLGSWCVPIH